MERNGTAPPLPEDGKCDMMTNEEVDDCRGTICDNCRAYANSHTRDQFGDEPSDSGSGEGLDDEGGDVG